MSDDRTQMARSFGAAATTYDAARPTYPRELVEWMIADVPTDAATIVDVGAGTGKLSRVVLDVADGATVLAVDPDLAMLKTLQAAEPRVAGTIVGTAEAIPLADRSADAIVLGQAWHWVDPMVAAAETGRVLRPGGMLGLIWNVRDERVGWVAAMTAVINASAGERFVAEPERVAIDAPFAGIERRVVEWRRPMTRAELVAMVHTRSHYLTADIVRRAQIDHELGLVLDGVPELANGGQAEVPYVTWAFRCRRPA